MICHRKARKSNQINKAFIQWVPAMHLYILEGSFLNWRAMEIQKSILPFITTIFETNSIRIHKFIKWIIHLPGRRRFEPFSNAIHPFLQQENSERVPEKNKIRRIMLSAPIGVLTTREAPHVMLKITLN